MSEQLTLDLQIPTIVVALDERADG